MLINLVNTIRLICTKTILCLLLLSCSCAVFSQNEPDTAIVIEEPFIDTSYTESDDDSYGDGEFLQKWGRDSFRVLERKLPDDFADSLKKSPDFWYADADVKKKEAKKKENNARYVPLGQRTWFQTLLWFIIIAGFAGAIMWYLAESNVSFFRKKDSTVPPGGLSDEIPEDIFSINYQLEIDKAVTQKNFRLAVRLQFLRLLKKMADKNIIQYKHDRTNFDYLVQLNNTRHYHSFFRLARHYEYSWYGHFDVEEHAYKIIEGEFNQFDRDLNRA